MKQLQLRNGDLVVGPGGFSMVTGAAKVTQDLGAAVREVLGTDRFHPRWGTVLNDYVGGYQNDEAAMLVKSEIARVIQNYIVIQADSIIKDADAGRRSRYTSSEIVSSVSSIETQVRGDRLNVRVSVLTESGVQVNVLRTVEV